jgi:hypothetical protein
MQRRVHAHAGVADTPVDRGFDGVADCLFREDSYLKECDATVVAIECNGGIVLDRTVFYAASGGQPADPGTLTAASIAIISASFAVMASLSRPASGMSKSSRLSASPTEPPVTG